jgi:MurNAc alpha-1-phosphate uridylyltransferase
MNRKARGAFSLRPEIEAAVPDTAMVMAAGLGKRMRPLTASRPKPLVEVAGKALIDHALDRLRAAGVKKIVVNVHYLADAVEAHLKGRAKDFDVKISDERKQLLETGGGLVQAEAMIAADPFLVVNSDNYWIDGPADTLHLLASLWREGDMDALLLLVPQARAGNHGGQGDFHMRADGRLARRE